MLDDELLEAVKVYVDFISSGREKPGAVVMIEHRFDLSDVSNSIWGPLFGTADAVIYYPKEKRLQVVDLKLGAGIPVNVTWNKQLMVYGLGAALSLGKPIEVVELTIVQPRCFHPDGPIRTFTLSAVELLEFKADLVDAIRATEQPNAPLATGSHCQFCPAAVFCPKRHEEAQALAVLDFSEPVAAEAVTPEKVGELLSKVDLIRSWCNALENHAFEMAMRGVAVPGFKLVEKRQNRKWKEPEALAEFLQKKLKYNRDQIFEPAKLKSPAQMEKLLKEKNLQKSILDDFVAEKAPGELDLVSEHDRRPAVPAPNSALNDFSDLSVNAQIIKKEET